MAAQPLVRRSYADPVGTYATNVMGTVNVLEAVRQAGDVRVVVNVTTDKCYENREWEWGYREDEPLGGHDPYSNSKACAELVTAAYRESFFGPQPGGTASRPARAGNVIGGGDWGEDRLIPDIMRARARRGERRAIRNPDAIRPWQHVLNPLSGYLVLAEALWESDELAERLELRPRRARRAAGALDRRAPEPSCGASRSAGSHDGGGTRTRRLPAARLRRRHACGSAGRRAGTSTRRSTASCPGTRRTRPARTCARTRSGRSRSSQSARRRHGAVQSS